MAGRLIAREILAHTAMNLYVGKERFGSRVDCLTELLADLTSEFL